MIPTETRDISRVSALALQTASVQILSEEQWGGTGGRDAGRDCDLIFREIPVMATCRTDPEG